MQEAKEKIQDVQENVFKQIGKQKENHTGLKRYESVPVTEPEKKQQEKNSADDQYFKYVNDICKVLDGKAKFDDNDPSIESARQKQIQ